MVTTGFSVGCGGGGIGSIWLFDCILVIEITIEVAGLVDDEDEEEEDEEDVEEDVDDEDVLDVEPMRDDWDVCDLVLFGVGVGVWVDDDVDDAADWLELLDASFRLNFTLVAKYRYIDQIKISLWLY